METHAAFSLQNKDLCKVFLTLRIATLSQTFISSGTQWQSMMQASMSCWKFSSSSIQCSNYLQSEWVGWYGTMRHSHPEEGVCSIHQNVWRTETQDVADPNSQNHKVLTACKTMDKKHDTSCIVTDRIQLNVISLSKFITLTYQITHLIIQVFVQCDHYGCTCCDCCKLMNNVPISLGCYSICDESMKLITSDMVHTEWK